MAAGSHNFKIEQGTTFNNTLTYKQADDTAVDISGAQITLKAKDNRSDSTLVVDLSVGNGITITNAVAGQFTISIPSSTTANYTWNRADFDLDLTLSSTTERLISGQIQIIKSVA
jgi:hypothetical protein|tara:strand:+ start:1005 stop:1349 length:345 start_codon:yes stop_codon:yes gene_type:complete